VGGAKETGGFGHATRVFFGGGKNRVQEIGNWRVGGKLKGSVTTSIW